LNCPHCTIKTNITTIKMKLTSAQDAIKQAIEGGYKPAGGGSLPFEAATNPTEAAYILAGVRIVTRVLTDPLFWQALGTARGWREKDEQTARLVKLAGGIMMEKQAQWFRQAEKWFETRLLTRDEGTYWENLP
jgi:hypothetical protein